MARRTFPDEGSRLVYKPSTGALVDPGTTVHLYLDEAATQPALDLTDMSDVAITSGTVQVDDTRRVPLFKGPDGVDTLWAIVNGGVAAPVYSRADDRLDELTTGLALKENVVVHGATAGTARPAGATFVHWIGSVAPSNAATNDEWTDTANKLLKRWTGSAWDTLGSGGSGLPSTFQAKTANYTASSGEFVACDTSGGGFTVTLPASPTTGSLVTVKKTSSDGNTLTIAPSGGGTIDGDPTATTSAVGGGAVFEHVGSNVWRVTAVTTASGPAGPQGPAGATGATGATGPQGPAGAGAFPIRLPPPIGIPFSNTATTVGGTAGPAIGTASLCPVVIPLDCTLDRLGVVVQTGAASNNCRVGLYTQNAGTGAMSLVLDAGQVAATAFGAAVATISQTVSAGLYFVLAVAQGPSTGALYYTGGDASLQINRTSATDPMFDLSTGYSTTGVTGALPSSIAWASLSPLANGSVIRPSLRRSA